MIISFPKTSLVGGQPVGVDMGQDFFPAPANAVAVTATNTSYKLSYSASEYDVFYGSGFQYVAGGPASGTITSWQYVLGGKVYFQLTGEMDVATFRFFQNSGNWMGFLQRNLLLNDTVSGTAGADRLYAFGGDDVVNGGAGNDQLLGGIGNDIYLFDNAGDTAVEDADAGTDEVRTTATILSGFDHVENYTYTGSAVWSFTATAADNIVKGGSGIDKLSGGTGDDQLFGNAGNDELNGGADNDLLDGGAGLDKLTGGDGDDIYIVDNVGDKAIEDGTTGEDLVKASVSYVLGTGLEKLVLTGTGAINGTGNALANELTGNAGANTLDGQGGQDTMAAGKGNDIYIVDNLGDTVSEGLNEGTDLVRSSVTFTLGANVENLTLTDVGHIGGTGNGQVNIIIGNDGNNRLDGGAGADTLTGGKGNDTYVVDNIGDKVVESLANATGGIDRVESSITFSLAALANVDHLTLTGTANINGTGNALANTITGNDGNNILDGGAGNDLLQGGKGNDTYILDSLGDVVDETGNDSGDEIRSSQLIAASVAGIEHYTYTGSAAWSFTATAEDNIVKGGSGIDKLSGGAGDDQLYGNAGNDELNGGADNDLLDGGAGLDKMTGGDGDDIYVVDNIGDKAIEDGTSGEDLVKASISYVLGNGLEKLVLTGTGAINGTGNALANELTGNDGANTLDGQGGQDAMAAGKGNDIYVVDNSGDTVSEGLNEGTDLVRSSVTFTLGANVENLTLTDVGHIGGTGNGQVNIIIGNDGNNRLDGGAGADTLTGGKGNDTYVVDNIGDKVVESLANATGGIDRVESSITFSLAALANVDHLTLTGLANINGTGNALANTITGNDGNNILDGGAGNDLLQGGKGDDKLLGGLGDDILDGGAGIDTLIGGAGNDTYLIADGIDTIDELQETSTGDTALAGISVDLQVLGAGKIENATLTGTDDINAIGNATANTLIGNAGDNILDGGLGADKLVGGMGNDTYVVDNAGDIVTELGADTGDLVKASISYVLAAGLENLTLAGVTAINGTGNTTDNTLTGNAAANQLDGGAGADLMAGGKGDDTYFIDNAGDMVVENANEGTDTIASKISFDLGAQGANVENLTLTGSSNSDAIGNGLANILVGNAADNTLDGRGGSDTLTGGQGNDTYIVESAGDKVIESVAGVTGGMDLIISSVSFDLTTTPNVENLTLAAAAGNLAGAGNVLDNVITGNTGNNILDGGAGNDTLVGGGGSDTLKGGAGNDVYVAIDALVTIDEQGNKDKGDTVQASFSVDLSTLAAGQIENALLSGTADLAATGNAAANILTGNEGNNQITGGVGADRLTGAGGTDFFVFADGDTGLALGDRDLVTDFVSGIDKLDLSTIDADKTLAGDDGFNFLGTASFGGTAGDLRTVFDASRNVTVLEGDTNGDFVSDFAIEFTGKITINSGDFTANSLVAPLVLLGDDKANFLVGKGSGDTLSGAGGDDSLQGNGGDDILDGGTGYDVMLGGAGNDTYYVDSIFDRAEELYDPTMGIDTVFASIYYSLANSGVENLTLLDAAGDATATGNAFSNILVGNSGANTIAGAAGADHLTGGAGADTFVFANGDTGVGAGSRDLITDFMPNVDLLEISGLGSFFFLGAADFTGKANELHSVYDAADNTTRLSGDTNGDKNADWSIEFSGQVVLSEADFTFWSLVKPIIWVGDAAFNTYLGMALNDNLSGVFGDDRLYGLGGDDILLGGEGDDYLFGGGDNDFLDGGVGNDRLFGDVGEDALEGGDGNDMLFGEGSNDQLDGGAGVDSLYGGAGNDTYLVDSTDDVLTEESGVDTVVSKVSYALADGFENLTLATDAGDINGLGNSIANTILGNGGTNLIGGGGGADILTGGAGGDVFFFAAGDSGVTSGSRDLITDYKVGIDQLDLSQIDANAAISGVNAFTFVGTAGFSGKAGELHTVYDAAHNITIVEGDTNGDSVADFGIELSGKLTLSADDFVPIVLTGDNSANILSGGVRQEVILGLGGDDKLSGGGGDDTIDGGSGNDTAVFSGNADDYQFVYSIGGLFVRDIAGHGDGVDGLFGIEHIQFADKTIDIGAEPIIHGAAAGDLVGMSVASAGDVNHDGFDDLIIGASAADGKGVDAGAAYVVFGSAAGIADGFQLATLNGSNGFRLSGAAAGDQAGFSVASAGDINGDGYDDVVVGAWSADPHGSASGAAYVVFGKAGGFAADIDLGALNGSNGFKLYGAATDDFAGGSVQSAGDLNSDGFADIIIGANGHGAGSAYVVFGHEGAFASSLDLTALNGSNGFELTSPKPRAVNAGWSVDSVGDFNGDGIDDVIVGVPDDYGWGKTAGAAYIVFGRTGPFSAQQSLEQGYGTDVVRITGSVQLDTVGYSVAGAGDINADGFDDVIVSTPDAGGSSGTSYVVFGTDSGINSISVSTLDGSNGFKVIGLHPSDLSGQAVSSAGDVNGDGYADLLIGAPNAGSNSEGNAYVLFGQAGGFTATVDLQNLDSQHGFWVSGDIAGDGAGQSVAAAGDLNGDGFDDLVIGAPGHDSQGNSTGAAIIVYGSDLLDIDPKFGTINDDNIIGTGSVDTIEGRVGDDVLNGLDGGDALFGDAGNDLLVGGAGDDRLAGGKGNDGLEGGSGNDVLDGGSGANTAIFQGMSTDYALSFLSGALTVADLAPNKAGDEGVDTITHMQWLQFADKTIEINWPEASKDLADIDGANGYRFNGANAGDRLGYSVWSAGDINADGYDDVVIGAFGATVNGASEAGATYLIYGGAANLANFDLADGKVDGQINLAFTNGSNGFKIDGVTAGDLSGYSASGAGDVNADGIDDLMIGSRDFDADGIGNAGATYVLYGGTANLGALDSADGRTNGVISLAQVGGGLGFRLDGVGGADQSGWTVQSAGDVNGDGYDDMLVGARSANRNNFNNAGATYLVFGGTDSLHVLDAADGVVDSKMNLSALNGTTGYRVDGYAANVADNSTGYLYVGASGDVNGDGYSDLVVGSQERGTAYVIYGGKGNLTNFDAADGAADGHLAISALNASTGYRFSGGYGSGASVNSAGDVNNDGVDDLIIGYAYGAPDGHNFAGQAFLVFGGASNLALLDAADGDLNGGIRVDFINGSNGYRFDGYASGDYAGSSVSSAGDINADGIDDLLIGAFRYDADGISESGAAYVIYGGKDSLLALDLADSVLDGSIDLDRVNGTTGFRLDGVADTDLWAQHVAPAGDVNGDGYGDILLGAYGADPGGAAIVFFGGNFTGAVAHVGDDTANMFTGSNVAESFVGNLGDDVLIGNGGTDAFNGGIGNDRIEVSDLSFIRADGGAGVDTLYLDLGSSIDLGDLDGDATTSDRGRITEIEIIDLSNGMANALTLHLADVLDIEPHTANLVGVATLDNVLRIDGDSADTLALFGSDHWSAADAVTLAGYAIYTAGNVRVAVDTDIIVAMG